jgi:hypothetical protein
MVPHCHSWRVSIFNIEVHQSHQQTLLPHLRSVFDLNYVEMTLTESVTAIGQL